MPHLHTLRAFISPWGIALSSWGASINLTQGGLWKSSHGSSRVQSQTFSRILKHLNQCGEAESRACFPLMRCTNFRPRRVVSTIGPEFLQRMVLLLRRDKHKWMARGTLDEAVFPHTSAINTSVKEIKRSNGKRIVMFLQTWTDNRGLSQKTYTRSELMYGSLTRRLNATTALCGSHAWV